MDVVIPLLFAAADAPAAGWFELLLLAVVQGLTEFLPVSSSGHLVLVSWLLGRDLDEAGGVLVEVALHVGTLGAVFAIYGRDLVRIVTDALGGRARMLGLLVLGSVPAGLVGVLLQDFLEGLFREPRVAAGGLLVTTIVLFVSDQARRRRESAGGAAPVGRSVAVPAAVPGPAKAPRAVGVLDALVIGCAQAVAICPGVSRSGSTIAAGLLRGLDAADAARFSFLLSVPAIAGATLLQLRHLDTVAPGDAAAILVAVFVAAVVGFLALKLLLVGLARGAFRWFALYTGIVGVVLLAVLP